MHRGLGLVVGAILVLLGATLTLKPFTSLAVLILLVVVGLVAAGAGEVVRREPGAGVLTWVRAAAYLLGAVLVLVWPAATIRVIATVVAASLLVAGAADLVGARGASGTARFNAAVGGAASVAFGLLALSWPDVSVLVIAVVFGARLLIAGVRLLVSAIRGDDVDLMRRRGPRPSGGWLRLTGTVLGAILAVALVLVSLGLQRSTPRPDAFYDPPAPVPAQPGQLLRSERWTSPEVPAGASAWRILYTTTRDEGVPAVASGLVIAPASALTTPSPVVAWAHGTTGFAPGCAPSILSEGLSAGAMTIQDQVVARGWTMVATDYVGLGTAGPHPYLVGQGEGRSVLDAVRAAKQVRELRLADQTVVWGHSQGGHAALWTGILAPTYAAELGLVGVAALAPASNLPALVDSLGDVTAGELFASYVVATYTASYPDVRASEYVRPGARIIVDEMAQRCLAEKSVLVSVLTTLLLDKPIWEGNPNRGALQRRLVENVPAGTIPAPLLIGQGAADSLITPTAQTAYVHSRCASGQSVDYRLYVGRDHVAVVEADSPLIPELIAWTADRFEGKPAVDTC